MSTTLAIKYRPTTFEDVVGQSSTKAILENQLVTNTIKNAYLFCGSAGTGKTTCARIFANEINGYKGIPIEIDAASHSSVNDVREIVSQAQTKSIDSEYKIFIIDEAHSISLTGWQAFLKLLEEPPAKTIFIFATTDPQKIPKTILSRVQRYNFQRIPNKGIYDRLVGIIDKENDGITYEKEALSYITTLANGGLRDAITMLDKCISHNKHLTLDSVVEALNKTNPQTMVELCEALLGGEKKDIIEIIEEIHNSGADLKVFIKEFTDFLLDVCKYILTNSFEYTMYLSESNKNWLRSISSSFDLITSFLDKMTKLNSDIRYSDNPKYVVEATLILLGGE